MKKETKNTMFVAHGHTAAYGPRLGHGIEKVKESSRGSEKVKKTTSESRKRAKK